MKIVLTTQNRENYAAHDWDGKGVCPERWKFKGGNVYVVENVTLDEAQDSKFWDLVESSLTEENDYFETYIINSSLEDDVVDISAFHETYETPIFLTVEGGRMFARQSQVQDGYMNANIAEKRSAWEISNGGIVDDTFVVEYLLQDMVVTNWKGEPIAEPVLFDIWINHSEETL